MASGTKKVDEGEKSRSCREVFDGLYVVEDHNIAIFVASCNSIILDIIYNLTL